MRSGMEYVYSMVSSTCSMLFYALWFPRPMQSDAFGVHLRISGPRPRTVIGWRHPLLASGFNLQWAKAGEFDDQWFPQPFHLRSTLLFTIFLPFILPIEGIFLQPGTNLTRLSTGTWFVMVMYKHSGLQGWRYNTQLAQICPTYMTPLGAHDSLGPTFREQ